MLTANTKTSTKTSTKTVADIVELPFALAVTTEIAVVAVVAVVVAFVPAPEVVAPAPEVVPVPDVVVPAEVVVPAPEVVVPAPEVVVPAPEVVVPAPEVVVPAPEVVVPAAVDVPVPVVPAAVDVPVPVVPAAVDVPVPVVPAPVDVPVPVEFPVVLGGEQLATVTKAVSGVGVQVSAQIGEPPLVSLHQLHLTSALQEVQEKWLSPHVALHVLAFVTTSEEPLQDFVAFWQEKSATHHSQPCAYSQVAQEVPMHVDGQVVVGVPMSAKNI